MDHSTAAPRGTNVPVGNTYRKSSAQIASSARRASIGPAHSGVRSPSQAISVAKPGARSSSATTTTVANELRRLRQPMRDAGATQESAAATLKTIDDDTESA